MQSSEQNAKVTTDITSSEAKRDPCDPKVTGRTAIQLPHLKETFTSAADRQASVGKYKVCVLPLHYHVAVTYPQMRFALDKPFLLSVRERDVYDILGRPEKFATFIHWPGSARKPWNHWNELCRTTFDKIWWQAHDDYVAENPMKKKINMFC